MDIKSTRIEPIKPVDSSQTTQTKPEQFFKQPTGNWSFALGKLYLNGKELGELVKDSADEKISFWTNMVMDLEDFRDYYFKLKFSRRRKNKKNIDEDDDEVDPTGELGQLSGLVDAFIEKIMRHIQKQYNATKDGLNFVLDEDGQLILNGLNATAFILMAKRFPSAKARLYLKGLKERLLIILHNKSQNPNYEKIQEAIFQLIEEIDFEIKK